MKSILLFFTLFVLLVTYTGGLRLYVDDFPYLLGDPSLTHAFWRFVPWYTALHGLYRPVAIGYYWFIYSLYELSPTIAHAVPIAIHVATGYGLYALLTKHGMLPIFSLLAGLLFTVHPFAAEQYMWLSANPGTLANAILVLQLLLLTKGARFLPTLVLVSLLSLVSVLLYESTFFSFLPLGYLFWVAFPRAKAHRVALAGILLAPAALYGLSKALIPASDPRPFVDNPGLLLHHASQAFDNLVKVHSDAYYTGRFWSSYLREGWQQVAAAPAVIIAGGAILVGTAVAGLFRSNHADRDVMHPRLAWIIMFLASLLPLIANKEFYFGFRSLFLPSITGTIVLLWLIQAVGRKATRHAVWIVGLGIVGAWFFIDVAIGMAYQKQYAEDMRAVSQIASIVDSRFPESQPGSVTVILKSEVVFDSRQRFLHADHLLGCLFYEWSGIPCLATQTNRVGILAIQHADGRRTVQKGMDDGRLEEKRPLLMLVYKADGEVVVQEALP